MKIIEVVDEGDKMLTIFDTPKDFKGTKSTELVRSNYRSAAGLQEQDFGRNKRAESALAA